jgi:hypothetical protein
LLNLWAAAEDSLLDLGNRFGHLDTAGARLGAVEGGAAPPHTFFVIQDIEADLGRFIT